MRGALERRNGQSGWYWALNFDIALEFGGTELKAFLEWKEKVNHYNLLTPLRWN